MASEVLIVCCSGGSSARAIEATQLFRSEVLGDYSIHGPTKVLYDIVIVRVTNVARRGLGIPPCPSLTSQARYTGLRGALCRLLNQGAFLSALINETGIVVALVLNLQYHYFLFYAL